MGRGSWPTKTPLPNPVKTYLPVSALGPSAGSWGIQSSSFSSPFHFVLCHSWCLAQRGHDPYPHGSFHLVLGMPFRRSGIHGTKNFISFVVIITITTFIIFTISSSCSTRQGRICTGKRCHPNCVSVCLCVCVSVCLCVCVSVCLCVCVSVSPTYHSLFCAGQLLLKNQSREDTLSTEGMQGSGLNFQYTDVCVCASPVYIYV